MLVKELGGKEEEKKKDECKQVSKGEKEENRDGCGINFWLDSQNELCNFEATRHHQSVILSSFDSRITRFEQWRQSKACPSKNINRKFSLHVLQRTSIASRP
jgi:hypothetical protein